MRILTLLFLFIGLMVVQAKAQSFGGFFGQQNKKEKLLVEQNAQLTIYRQLLKGGYDIKANGLRSAHRLKETSFDLHRKYFTSLQQVAPAIVEYPKVKEISYLQEISVTTLDRELEWQGRKNMLSQKELTYFRQIYDNLLTESRKDLSELTDLLTKGKLQLTDEQRLSRLDQLYAHMKDKYLFAAHFTDKCRKLAKSRLQAGLENAKVKELYGIH